MTGEIDPREPHPPEPYPRGLARLRHHVIDLTPLRVSHDFRLLFAGMAVSDLGNEITFVAVPFQVFDLTHSTLAVGLLGLCDLAPLLFMPVIGGMIADTVERRRMVLAVNAVMMLLSVALLVNASRPEPRLWVLEMRGRLEGMGLTVWATGPSLGNVEAGIVASATTVPISIVSGDILCVLGVLAHTVLVPSFRNYDAERPIA